MVSPVIAAVIAVVAGVVAAAIAFFAGVSYRRKTAEAKIGSAEEEAKRLINDAMKAAQQKRKEALIEAKDEAFQLKAEADKEIKERRSELSRQERRLDQKEEAMDRKTAVLEQKETDLAKRSELVEARLDEIEQIKARELDKMETIAGLTAEDAKQLLLNRLDEQLTHEKAMHIAAFESQTKDECDTMARELISQAVARCAADHSSEATVSVVPLPSDEMKGRIIGREGRNIRALETATGVDLIIDDTPDVVTLSGFDPVRREIARITLEKLIQDGRIHPARIEEVVAKVRKQVEEEILKISLDLSSYKPKEKATKLEIMQSQLEKEQIKLKRLYNLYADGNDTVLEMIKELEAQIKEMKANIAVESKNAINTQKKEFVYENIKKLADIWDKVDKKQKNLILKTIIDKIVIVNGNIEIQLKNF